MSDPTIPPVAVVSPPPVAPVAPAPVAVAAAGTVSFSLGDAMNILQSLGTAASAIDPALGGAVAAAEGIAALIRNTIIPAITNSHNTTLTIAQQVQLQADSAAERARVGAPAATIN